MERKMAWSSYVDSIDAIRCDLEHLAGCSSKPAELDTCAARAVVATAERLLCQMREAREVAADSSLEVAGEVVRLRALVVEQEKRRRVALERIGSLTRDAAARAQETIYWRDEYFALSRRRSSPRRRR